MTEKQVIRWGIIGCGHIARTFINSARAVNDCKIVACAASDPNRAQQFAQEHQIEQVFDSYQALVDSNTIDAVYIATTHNFHFAHTKLALEASKHVMCEKPLGVNHTESSALFALAQQQKCLLMEAVWTRTLPAIIAMKTIVEQGKIGQIKHISASFCLNRELDKQHRLRNPDLAGGALLDLGIYPLTFADILLDKDPLSLSSHCIFDETGVDQTSAYHLQYEGGISAHLVSSYRMDAPIEAMVYADNGYIKVPHFLGAQGFEIYRDNTLLERHDFSFDPSQNFCFEIAHFQACIQTDKQDSHLIPASASLRIARLMDALKAAWSR